MHLIRDQVIMLLAPTPQLVSTWRLRIKLDAIDSSSYHEVLHCSSTHRSCRRICWVPCSSTIYGDTKTVPSRLTPHRMWAFCIYNARMSFHSPDTDTPPPVHNRQRVAALFQVHSPTRAATSVLMLWMVSSRLKRC
jgi:hypothetical protein